MIIPKHKRTIYIDDITFGVKEKFLLNLPSLEFTKDDNSYRCLAIEDGIKYLPPFLNCNHYGYICFGRNKPNNEKKAVERFFTTSFNFDAYDSMLNYWDGGYKGLVHHFVETVVAFYKNWERTGEVTLKIATI